MYRVLFILLVLCAALWARPKVFVDTAVELDGVHKDYAEKVVRQTESVLRTNGDVSVAESAYASDFLLQIKMLRQDDGILVVYSLLNSSDKATVWTYKHMAYTPDDLNPIVDVVSLKFGQWNGLRWGLGLGATGLLSPEVDISPTVDLSANYLYKDFLISWDFAWAFDVGLDSRDFGSIGTFLTGAHVLGGHSLFPYVGPGIGFSMVYYNSDKYEISDGGLAFLLRMGAFYKPAAARVIYALDVRYLYNYIDFENARDGKLCRAHGWNVSAQVWW